MKTRAEALVEEIRELEALIARGRLEGDPESCWAVALLETLLERRREQLRQALN